MARGFHAAPGADPEVDDVTRPGLCKAALAVHAQSKNPLVREIVAGRADCSLGLLVTLAHDRNVEVRAAVAGNPAATPAILDHLSLDRSVEVLLALLENPSVPAELVERLAFHRKEGIRRAAVVRLDEFNGVVSSASAEDAATPELRDVAAPTDGREGLDPHSARSHTDSRPDFMENGGTAQSTHSFTRTVSARGFELSHGADGIFRDRTIGPPWR